MRTTIKTTLICLAVGILLSASGASEISPPVTNPYSVWEDFVPEDDPWFFPIAVYTQEPWFAGLYKNLGINLYYYLWEGPTAEQIALLKKHDMRVIADFNEYAEKHLVDDPIVAAWTQHDEPDIAVTHHTKETMLADPEQAKALMKEIWPEMYKEMELDTKPYAGEGFGLSPDYCERHYNHIKSFDRKRPVFVGLSSLVIKHYPIRGDREGHPEDYPEYVNRCGDMVAFDIYPVAYGLADELNLVPKGVDQLNEWDTGDKPKWVAIECTFGRPSAPVATPDQIRAEIWMSIIRGARGIGYFVHHFNRNYKCVTDEGLLRDPEMMAAVKKQNAEIQSLARVIYAPEIDTVTLRVEPEVELDFKAKKVDGLTYIFASTTTTDSTTATFTLKEIQSGMVEVVNEDRILKIKGGTFTDDFGGYDVNLYRIISE